MASVSYSKYILGLWSWGKYKNMCRNIAAFFKEMLAYVTGAWWAQERTDNQISLPWKKVQLS